MTKKGCETYDTLTFEAGAGIVLTNDATNDKITIAGGSGSVFTTDFFTASGSGSALLAYTLSTTPSSENELIKCFQIRAAHESSLNLLKMKKNKVLALQIKIV